MVEEIQVRADLTQMYGNMPTFYVDYPSGLKVRLRLMDDYPLDNAIKVITRNITEEPDLIAGVERQVKSELMRCMDARSS